MFDYLVEGPEEDDDFELDDEPDGIESGDTEDDSDDWEDEEFPDD